MDRAYRKRKESGTGSAASQKRKDIMKTTETKGHITFGEAVKREFRIIRKRKKSYLYVLILLETVCAGVLPYLTVLLPKILIDRISEHQALQTILTDMAAFFGCLLLLAVISLLCNSRFDGDFVELRMKELSDLQDRYQSVPYRCLEDPDFVDRSKEAMRALGNPTGFEGVYRNFIRLCPCAVTILIYTVQMCRLQPVIALICAGAAALSLYFNFGISGYIARRRPELAKAERQKDYFCSMGYDFSYGKDIRIFQMAPALIEEYREKSDEYTSIAADIENREFRLACRGFLGIALKDGAALAIVIWEFYRGMIGLGDVSLYFGMILSLSSILEKMTQTCADWIKCVTYARGYFEFMSGSGEEEKKEGLPPIGKEETLEVEFRNVSFCYPGTERWILRNLNLKIRKGEKVAVVGVNGAGKTTLVKLLTGLFPATEGEIRINGTDSTRFDPERYREMFSTVYQDVRIYAATVLENVSGETDTDETVRKGKRCLEAAGLREAIERLPKTYDTPLLKIIEDGGTELSGGQNQKLAIARALYKDANMVILDEPTASLDALAESEIYQRINQLVGEKTAVYISHRLSSTVFCDRIILLSGEGIAESGSHEELMKRKGLYYHMFETQGQYYRDGGKDE